MRRAAARGHRQPQQAWRPASLAAFVILAALFVTRLATPAPTAELHVGVSRVPASLDPAEASTPPQLMAMRLLYEGLVAFGERGDIEPALASSWAVSRDGLVWTFRLRPDILLHDGTSLGPDEIVAALGERISLDEAAEGAPPWARPFRGAGRVVREVRRGEGASVQVVLGQPYSPVLALLAHPALGVAVARAGGPRIGTGPYRAVELTPDRLVLEAAPAWRGEAPQSARLTLHAVPDDAAAFAGLGPGGPLHAALVSAPPAWAALGLQVASAPTWRLGLMALRTDQGLTSRKALRQAVALGLDPGLMRPALGQWAAPHAGWLPPGAWAARDAGALLFDLPRARRLLAQVAPIDPTLTLLASERVSGPEAGSIAEAVRLSLEAVGFRVKVRLEAPDTVESAARQGTAELTLREEALEVNDPDVFFRRLLATEAATPGGATNVAFFRSPLVDGMLARASQLGFRPERFRLYQRLQGLLGEEVPYVPLYVRLQWMVARPEVRGMRLDPGGLHHLERMRLEVPPASPPPSAEGPPPGSTGAGPPPQRP
ncbi:MAG TPA: ABC transporter substrate-binding protein [Methylomirabilota bacterium]|nr:ABC transporter substrate-binding protein [Methylomirabilota bacterium]